MRIQFIFPPYTHKKFEEDIDIVSREFGLFPPLGLAFAAAIAREHGHTVDIIDARALKLSQQETLERLKAFKPDMLGFMLTAYMFHDTLDWIKFFKQQTGIPIVVGNVLMELYPREVMAYDAIDYGIIGSAQKAFPQLLTALEQSKSLSNIKGLCFRDKGRCVINPPDDLSEDFAALPFPARDLLPNERYHAVMSKRRNMTIMVTSRGCPYQCSFCSIAKIGYTCRTPVMVVKEMVECYEKYNIREIEIFDPTFNVNKQRVVDICNGIIESGIDIDWACRARVDKMDEQMLRLMRQAGCKRILYGIESGDQEMLNRVNKGITLKQIRRAIDLTRKHKIKTLGFFLLGAPEETAASMRKTIDFSKKLKLDYAQFHQTVPKPQTYLYEQVMEKTNRDLWKEYIQGSFPETRMPAVWTDLSQKLVEQYAIIAYCKFYFRIGYLLKTLISIKSFNELNRYIRSFFGVLFSKKDC
ncbi:MAG: B12-binding domain-containing radical SAM protein [Candidatus Omnitrophica bacterium]|nr:B12-binding domain-containing radical SAM protein [Candidatus Omnitrophota bacterium]